MISFAKHSPSRGHVAFFGQLHLLSSSNSALLLSILLLWPSIMDFTLGMQL